MANPNHVPAGGTAGGQFTSAAFSDAQSRYMHAEDALDKAETFDELMSARDELSAAKIQLDSSPEGQRDLKEQLKNPSDEWERVQLQNRLDAAKVARAQQTGNTKGVSIDKIPLIPVGEHTYDLGVGKIDNEGSMYEGHQGPKYTKYRPLKDIAKDVRDDLKEAQAKGYLPAHLKYSVKIETGGTGVLHVEAQGAPDSLIYKDKNGMRRDEVYTPEAIELEKRLDLIASAYNRSASQTQIDYYDETYYTRAKVEDSRARKWREDEADKAKKRREELAVTNVYKKSLKNNSFEGFKAEHETTTVGTMQDGTPIHTVDGTGIIIVGDQNSFLQVFKLDSPEEAAKSADYFKGYHRRTSLNVFNKFKLKI